MKVLCIDLGATSGRAIVFQEKNQNLTEVEVGRFYHTPKTINNNLCWDIDVLIENFFKCIKDAVNFTNFDAISIDSWGVDYVPIGFDGKVFGSVLHYRDSTGLKGMEIVSKVVSDKELYNRTGTQINQINTINRLTYLSKSKEGFKKINKILMIPDFFNYLLTGEMYLEKTNASTTGLFNPYNHTLDFELCSKLDILTSIFPEIINTGKVIGTVNANLVKGRKDVAVIAAPSHDIASAVAAISHRDGIFLSCGTWNLVGMLLPEPIINDMSRKKNFTNELASNGQIRFLKNIPGSWLLEEYRRELKKIGTDLNYNEIQTLAQENSCKTYIDPEYKLFFSPGSFLEKLQKYCIETNQEYPNTSGKVIRALYKGQAMSCAKYIKELEHITQRKSSQISMVGGGSRSSLFCQMVANYSEKIVLAGPYEATAYGNAISAFSVLGRHIKTREPEAIYYPNP